MEAMPVNIAVIGLGDRSIRVGLPCIIECSLFILKAVCDIDSRALSRVQAKYDVQTFENIGALLAHRQECLQHGKEQEAIQAAYVALPHNQYGKVVPLLLKHGLHVLKEKPAGMNVEELRQMQQLAAANKVYLCTASQSRFSDRLRQAQEHLPNIGNLKFIEGTRKVSVANLAEGWRSQSAVAGGGTVNDIGWHLLDELVGFIGSGARMIVVSVRLFQTRASDTEDYDCEDSAHIALEFQRYEALKEQVPVSCNLRISRVGVEKVDEIVLVGARASLIVHRDAIIIQPAGSSRQQVHRLDARTTTRDFRRMLEYFHATISSSIASAEYHAFARQDADVTEIIEAVYRDWADKNGKRFGGGKTSQLSSENLLSTLKYQWPKITKDLEHAVIQQLRKDISIYDNGGVFQTFETEFLRVHKRPGWHSLLHNSGTNALQALFYAARFLPGDEVSAKYGFFFFQS